MYYQRPLPRYSSSPYEQPRHNRRYFSPMSLLEEPTEEPPLNETPILPISEENETPAVQENETQQAEPANETPTENAENVYNADSQKEGLKLAAAVPRTPDVMTDKAAPHDKSHFKHLKA